MRILVACEFSGIVRDAFAARGHDVISCDLLESEQQGNHYQGDLFEIINYPFDLAIFHPDCTHLAVSGARHFKEKKQDGRQYAAVSFVMKIVKESNHIPKIAIENPISVLSNLWRKPDQIIQPWQFGHGETKATCLWLKNLPLLQPTNIVTGRENRVHWESPGPERWKNRSRTFWGIATAMAEQWG